MNLAEDANLTLLERLRRIRNTVDLIIGKDDDELTDYQQHLHHEQRAVLCHVQEHLMRIVNFIAIYDGYLNPHMNPDRIVEFTRRLEKEVFGAAKLSHPRAAHLILSDPINLKDYFAAFQSNKRDAVEQVSTLVESKLISGLKQDSPEADRLDKLRSQSVSSTL